MKKVRRKCVPQRVVAQQSAQGAASASGTHDAVSCVAPAAHATAKTHKGTSVDLSFLHELGPSLTYGQGAPTVEVQFLQDGSNVCTLTMPDGERRERTGGAQVVFDTLLEGQMRAIWSSAMFELFHLRQRVREFEGNIPENRDGGADDNSTAFALSNWSTWTVADAIAESDLGGIQISELGLADNFTAASLMAAAIRHHSGNAQSKCAASA